MHTGQKTCIASAAAEVTGCNLQQIRMHSDFVMYKSISTICSHGHQFLLIYAVPVLICHVLFPRMISLSEKLCTSVLCASLAFSRWLIRWLPLRASRFWLSRPPLFLNWPLYVRVLLILHLEFRRFNASQHVGSLSHRKQTKSQVYMHHLLSQDFFLLNFSHPLWHSHRRTFLLFPFFWTKSLHVPTCDCKAPFVKHQMPFKPERLQLLLSCY